MYSSQPFRAGIMAMFVVLTAGLVVWAQPARQAQQQHGYLGVLVAPAEQAGQGIQVQQVTPDSPAAKAGLKQGDQILKLGDEKIANVEKFLQAVEAKKPGDKVILDVLRGGKEQNMTVTLGERPAREAFYSPGASPLRRPAFLGVQTQTLTPELHNRMKIGTKTGALVTEVVPNSPAAKAGLKRDDVITAINDRPVSGPMELRNAIQEAGAGKEITLQVVRGTEKQTLHATPQAGAFGYFLTPGEEQSPTVDVESMFDQGRRIRELERRIADLEKQIRQLEKK